MPEWAKGEDSPYESAENLTVTVLYKVDLSALTEKKYGEAFKFITSLTDPARGQDRDVIIFPKKMMIDGKLQYVMIHRPVSPYKYEEFKDQPLPSMVISAAPDFYSFAKTGTLTGSADTFQMAVAMAVTKSKDKFKKARLNYGQIVAIVNTLDVGTYLGTAPISMQTRNGFEYFKDFLGASTVIVSSEIPAGTVIAIPADNIVLYYIDPSDSEFAELGLVYTTAGGETNLIGVQKEGVYGHASGDTHVLMGMTMWAEYLDAIAVISFGA
jgi:hypothetical protein